MATVDELHTIRSFINGTPSTSIDNVLDWCPRQYMSCRFTWLLRIIYLMDFFRQRCKYVSRGDVVDSSIDFINCFANASEHASYGVLGGCVASVVALIFSQSSITLSVRKGLYDIR
jgi:hypothetical protein